MNHEQFMFRMKNEGMLRNMSQWRIRRLRSRWWVKSNYAYIGSCNPSFGKRCIYHLHALQDILHDADDPSTMLRARLTISTHVSEHENFEKDLRMNCQVKRRLTALQIEQLVRTNSTLTPPIVTASRMLFWSTPVRASGFYIEQTLIIRLRVSSRFVPVYVSKVCSPKRQQLSCVKIM